MPASSPPELRADGMGMYVWEDKLHPGHSEALCFEFEPSEEAVERVFFVNGEAVIEAPGSPRLPSRSSTPSTASNVLRGGRGKLQYSRGPCARESTWMALPSWGPF